MQRLLFALFLALALLLASLPVRAGGHAPLMAADPVGSFLGISLALFAAALLCRAGLEAVRARTRCRRNP